MKGGYVLVNATGVDLNVASGTVAGIFKKFDNALATGKLIIIEKVVNDDAALSPISAVAYYSSGDIVVVTSIGATLTITDEDAVVVS